MIFNARITLMLNKILYRTTLKWAALDFFTINIIKNKKKLWFSFWTIEANYHFIIYGLAAKGARAVFEQSWIILCEYKRFTLPKSIFNSIYQCGKTKGK